MQSPTDEADAPAESPLRLRHPARVRGHRSGTAETHTSLVPGSSSPLAPSATSPSVRSHSGVYSLSMGATTPSSPIVPRPGDGSGVHDDESPLVSLHLSMQKLCAKASWVRESTQEEWSAYQLRIKAHGEKFARENLTHVAREDIEMMRKWQSKFDEKISSLVKLAEEFETVGTQIVLTHHDQPPSHNDASAPTEDEPMLDDSLQVNTCTARYSLLRLLGSAREKLIGLKEELANLTNRINMQRNFRPDRSKVDEDMDLSDENDYMELEFDLDLCKTKIQYEQAKISSFEMRLGSSSREGTDWSP